MLPLNIAKFVFEYIIMRHLLLYASVLMCVNRGLVNTF